MILTLGVLSLQGDFQQHIECLKKIEKSLFDNNNNNNSYRLNIIKVRDSGTLENVDALIIPGGESTVISRLLKSTKLFEEIQQFVQNPSKVVWGTCAGIILLANSHDAPFAGNIGGLDIKVGRNAYGRQIDSFKGIIKINEKEEEKKDLIDDCVFFIRAPRIIQVNEENTNLKVLAFRNLKEYDEKIEDDNVTIKKDISLQSNLKDGIEATAVLQDNRILGSTFHPEISTLENDEENHLSQWHTYFINLAFKTKTKSLTKLS